MGITVLITMAVPDSAMIGTATIPAIRALRQGFRLACRQAIRAVALMEDPVIA